MSYCSAIQNMSGDRKALHQAYHDHQYGFPIHDDNELFCRLVLEINQAGLSWETILKKEATFRAAYDNFDLKTVAAYTEADRERLLADAGIIRNRLKINSAINNARLFIAVQEEFGSFDKYLYSFMPDGKPITGYTGSHVSTPESDAISKDMKKRGFKFFGTTICYAFMQATGMVNDHVPECDFR